MIHKVLVTTLVVFAAVTIIVCFSVTLSMKYYVGGIPWPYISDTGRDLGVWVVFGIGFTVASLCMSGLAIFYVHQIARPHLSNDNVKYSILKKITVGAALVIQFIASICLILLSCFSDLWYPDIHFQSAIIFFVLTFIFLILQTFMHIGWFAPSKVSDDLTSKFWISMLFFFTCFFLIYIPIGLSLLCSWQFLSVQGLEEICKTTPNYYCNNISKFTWPTDPNTTLFYDYSNCPGTHTLRTSFQFLTVISLFIFYIGYAFLKLPKNENSSESNKSGEKGNQNDALSNEKQMTTA